MKKILIALFVLLLIASMAWTGHYFWKKSQKPPVVYQTIKPQVGTIIKKTVATGSIVPKKEVDIKPQVSGILDKIYVEEGQRVERGQTLAKIKVIPNMSNLSNAETNLERQQISLRNAQQNFDRQKQLFEQKVISEQDFQDAKVTLDLAKQDVAAARENLQIIKEGTPRNAGSTTTLVKATVSGTVLSIPVKEGASVIESNTFNEGTTIAQIANMSEMEFQGKVDESEVGKLKPGMDLLLTIGAIEDEQFEAKLKFIAPKGVEEEGAIKFEIKADVSLKEGEFIRAGYSANADIVLDRRDSVLTLEESALIIGKKDSVFAEVEVAPQQFEKRQIKIGLSDGIKVEVVEGLSAETSLKVQNQL